MGQLVLVRSIEKMELHVYYYPILILFLANSASAILQRQKELQAFGDLLGVTSDPDDNLDSLFQDQPQQSLRQQPGLNFGNFDDLNQFLNPQKTKANRFFYHDHEDHDHEENCEQKVVPLDDVVKIVKIIFEKLPSICVSRLKVCGPYPGTPNPYPKPPYKPEDPYHKPHHHHHHHHHKQKSNLYKNMKQNPLSSEVWILLIRIPHTRTAMMKHPTGMVNHLILKKGTHLIMIIIIKRITITIIPAHIIMADTRIRTILMTIRITITRHTTVLFIWIPMIKA